MNWYKRALEEESGKDMGLYYTDVGHDYFYGDEYSNEDNSNYMWILINGVIDIFVYLLLYF